MTRPGRSFGANVLISFAFTGFMTALAIGNSIVVARLAGAEGRGLYALAVAALGIAAPIAGLGMSFGATWYIGRGGSARETISLNHLWSGFLLLVCAAGAAGLTGWYGGLPTDRWAQVALTTMLSLPAIVYAENARGAFLGLNQVVRFNAVHATSVGTMLIANLTLLRLGSWAVLLALGTAYWVLAVGLLIGHLRHIGAFTLPSREMLVESVSYGVRASGSNLIEILLLRLDYLLVTPIVGVAVIGLYSVADQVSLVLAWGGLVAGRMMLAESARDVEGKQARRKLGLGVRTLLVVVGLASVVAAATGWFLLPLLFGEEFSAAYVGMLVLLPTAMLRGATGLLGTYLVGRNVIRPVLIAGVGALVVIVVLSPLAATVSWIGIAVVRVLALIVQLILTTRAYREETGERFRWIFSREDYEALSNWVRVRLARRAGGPSSE